MDTRTSLVWAIVISWPFGLQILPTTLGLWMWIFVATFGFLFASYKKHKTPPRQTKRNYREPNMHQYISRHFPFPFGVISHSLHNPLVFPINPLRWSPFEQSSSPHTDSSALRRRKMGIQGLLPLLKSIMVPIHIKDLKGSCVAVDTYSWLHKGALSCSKELCKGVPTSRFLFFNGISRIGMMGFCLLIICDIE